MLIFFSVLFTVIGLVLLATGMVATAIASFSVALVLAVAAGIAYVKEK